MECSGKCPNGPAARSRSRRLREGLICLLVLIVQFPGSAPGVREIMQPTFAVGIIGKATSFNCRLRYGEGKVSRIHLYLYTMNARNHMEVVHPSVDDSYKKRIHISNNGDNTDKSVQISDLHFNDTNMYYCKMSFVEDATSSMVTGNGTLLFVHGPLNLKNEMNRTVVCEVQVRMVEGVEIVWTEEDTEIAIENTAVEIPELGTYRIISKLSVHVEPTNRGLTTNISCLLRHKIGGNISKQSMIISGTCDNRAGAGV